MATGLFESPPQPASRSAEPTGDGDGYRPLSGVAMAAAALAAASPLAFVDWWLAVVPILAILLGGVALRDIARRPQDLAGRPLAVAAICLAAACLAGGLTRLGTVYAAELPPGFQRLSYALLQPAAGDPPTAVPEAARGFDGRDVLLKGYMYPGSHESGIVQFLLVRDKGDCCFGGNPKITDRVLVNLADPRGIEYTDRMVKIAGRFRVRPVAAPGSVGGGVLYHIEAAERR